MFVGRGVVEHLPSTVSALQVRGIVKQYGSKAVLGGVGFDLAAGEVFGVVGPNGAGKTTLLRILLGLVRPSSGTVTAFGRPMPDRDALAQVGASVERPAFFGWLDAQHNLAAMAMGSVGRVSEDIDRVLDEVGLSSHRNARVGSYSEGMRQRLALAGALLGRPKLLVLDEPTNGLDPLWIRNVREIVRRRRDEGVAVLLTSHLLAEVEQLCDRVALLDVGTITEIPLHATSEGPEASVRARVASRDLEAAIAALAGFDTTGRPDGVIVVRGRSVRDVSRAFREAGVDVEELTTVRPSLEERLYPTRPAAEENPHDDR